MGYHRAGFEVVGVDINPQPHHWDQSSVVQFDALRVLAENPEFIRTFDAIHASPPCQASTALTKGTNKATRSHLHVDLIGQVRDLLDATGLPYVIENVQGAKVRRDLTLCGEMFGLDVIRHRYFELGGWSAPQPEHKPHRGRVRGWRHGLYFDGPYFAVYGDGGAKGSIEEWQSAMGIDWIPTRRHLAEAIPPAYTEYVGAHLVDQIGMPDRIQPGPA